MLDLDLGAVFLRTHHDLAEFLFGLQTVGQAHRIGELRSRRGRLGAELAPGHDHVLGPDGVHDLGNADAQVGQLVGLDPDAHGIIGGPQHVHPSDALDAGQDVLDVDQGIIAKEILVVAVAFGRQGDQHQDVGQRFFSGNPHAGDFRGQLGRGGRHPVLGKDRVHVRVGAHFEGGLDHHGAVIGVGGLHVDHVVHPVDLLLQGGGHGILHRQCVGTGVVRTHLHDRRGDVGILLDRQVEQGERSHDNRNDRNDDGHDGPSDKKIPHTGLFLFRRVQRNVLRLSG